MVTVQRLYGACHGLDLEYGFWKFPVNLKHSTQMLEELASLPKGTKVGIESMSDGDREKLTKHFKKKKLDLRFHGPSEKYWSTLVGYCRNAGLEVVHLEDLDAHIETAEKFAAVDRIRQKVYDGAQLHEKMYVAETIAEWYFAFAREPGMIERIMRSSPAAVIVGRSHADHFWTNQEQTGVSFGSYGAEDNVQDFDHVASELRMLASASAGPEDIAEHLGRKVEPNILAENKVDGMVLLERQLIERKYRAAAGQTLTSEIPCFSGTWNQHVPAQGRFEIFPDNEGITGRCEDVLGTAQIKGDITLSSVSFIKKYDPARSERKVLPGQIRYEGKWIGDRYRGQILHPRAHGTFDLWPVGDARARLARRS